MGAISSDQLSFVALCAFVLTVFLWGEWQGRIRPLLIPRAEIERLADELVDKHGERAEEFAAIEEDRAWRYSQNFEQGKWLRVRKELERRSRL